MSIARDVDIAIRAHDYIEAMRVLKLGLGAYENLQRLNRAEVAILLRPSVAIAAAIADDEEALRVLDRAAAVFAEHNPGNDVLITKAAENWAARDMVRWVDATTTARQGISVERLEKRARTHGHRNTKQALRMLERHKVLHVIGGAVHRGMPEPKLSSVPPFKAYFSTRDNMDAAQTAFYDGTFKPAFFRDEYVDLEGSISYGFVLIGEYAAEHGYDDLEQLRSLFLRAAAFYPETGLAGYAVQWAADTFFLEGEYQLGYDLLAERNRVDIRTYLGIGEALVDSRITGAMAWDWTTSDRLTTYGQKNKAGVLREVEQLLDEEHSRLGRDVVSATWSAITERGSDEPAPTWLVELMAGQMSAEQMAQTTPIERYGPRQEESFRGLVGPASPPITWPSSAAASLEVYSTSTLENIIRTYLLSVFRKAENNFRVGAGVPRVGEGWVSEVALFHALRDSFPQTRVVHQGRPAWLKPQSLDILFLEWGVAVEYQGEQHQRPVTRFGGEAAFVAQRERDARKRQLCEANGLTLIEVLPDYVLDEVISQIRAARRPSVGE